MRTMGGGVEEDSLARHHLCLEDHHRVALEGCFGHGLRRRRLDDLGNPRHVPLPFLRSFPRNWLQRVPAPGGWKARGSTSANLARHGPRASDDARNYGPIADGLERAIGLATRRF